MVCFASTLLFSSFFSSFTVAQLAYSKPDGKIQDDDPRLTIYQGSVAGVVWKLNSTNYDTKGYVYSQSGADPKSIFNSEYEVSLWITSTSDQGNNKGYTKCLAPHIKTDDGNSFQWTVDLSDDDINNHNGQFTYRLKPAVADVNAVFNDSEIEAPSRGFFILKDNTPDSSSSSSPTNSPTSTPRQEFPSSSPSAPPAVASNGITGGAIAGIVVGVIAAFAILIGGILLWLRRRKVAQARGFNNSAGGLGGAASSSYAGYNAQSPSMGQHPKYAPIATDQMYYGQQNTESYLSAPAELPPNMSEQQGRGTVELA